MLEQSCHGEERQEGRQPCSGVATAMTTQNLIEPLKAGTLVKIRNSGYERAKVAEFRGPLGPKGARIYNVLVQRKPRPIYIEVREDQLEVLNDE
jgi:hypothetical protein